MIVLSTGSIYSYNIARAFALAAEIGYDGVEVMVDGSWDTRQPAYLRRLCADSGLPIVALHNPFTSDVPGWPRDQLGRLQRTVTLAQELNVSLVVAHLPFCLHAIRCRCHGFGYRRFLVPVPLPRREPYYYFLRDGGIEDLERSSGVTIAVENMPALRFLGRSLNPYWFNSVEQLLRFPHLTLDTTHLGTWGLDPLAVYQKLRYRLAHVHLSNFDGREHRPPADGDLPLSKLLRRLASERYRGAISVESHPQALEAEEEERCRLALRRALAFCRAHYPS